MFRVLFDRFGTITSIRHPGKETTSICVKCSNGSEYYIDDFDNNGYEIRILPAHIIMGDDDEVGEDVLILRILTDKGAAEFRLKDVADANRVTELLRKLAEDFRNDSFERVEEHEGGAMPPRRIIPKIGGIN